MSFFAQLQGAEVAADPNHPTVRLHQRAAPTPLQLRMSFKHKTIVSQIRWLLHILLSKL
jgi:hypothetical protein